jgi:starch-binding outer membrane protein, SusD/RagB family
MKRLILSMALVLSLVSCDEALDRLPNDSLVSETAYKSVADLQLGLNGVMISYSTLGVNTVNSILTDEVKIGADNGGQQVSLYNMILDPQEGNSNGIWTAHYRAINRANRIIAAAAGVTPAANEVNQYNNILAQCYFVRALAHLDLMNHYAPNTMDLTGIAVPYIDFVNTSTQLPRNTVAEVRDGILASLQTAETLLPASSTDIYFATPKAIEFARAKVKFLTGDYTGALVHANNLILGQNGFTATALANATQYVNMFADTDNTEIIFKRRRTQLEGFIGGIWYFTGTGGAFLEMSNKVFNNLPGDVRDNVLFDATNSDPSIDLHLINKYPGSNGFLFLNDEKVMRISEMYLIKAECHARLSQWTDAANAVKAVRDARSGASTPVDVYANLQQAADAILDERFVELAYEGHRYVDIKRLRNVVNTGIVRDPADCGGAAPCELGVSDPRFTLPIPQAEMDTNANMVQNVGY